MDKTYQIWDLRSKCFNILEDSEQYWQYYDSNLKVLYQLKIDFVGRWALSILGQNTSSSWTFSKPFHFGGCHFPICLDFRQTHVIVQNICRYAPRPGFKAAGKPYTCNIEAMLVGHEDWVHTVAWQKNLERGSRATLLSASMDRTMAIWRPDKSTGKSSGFPLASFWINVIVLQENPVKRTYPCRIQKNKDVPHLWDGEG